MQALDVPTYIQWILYTLWNTTEFNAWKSTYNINFDGGDEYFNNLMGALQKANNYNDLEGWSYIRDVVSKSATNLSLSNKSPLDFKNYFIKTSFNRLKKMVKKYY